MSMELNLLYVHANWMGYGRTGVRIADELAKMGVTVYDYLENAVSYADDQSEVPAAGRDEGRSNVVCWIAVPSHGTGWYEGQVPCVFTMWEGMRLPEGMRECLHNFDTVIVPSPQNYDLFSRYHDNVKYVPLGVDPDDWHFQERKPVESTFRFLHAGSGKRKGPDVVVEAFKKVFPDGAWGDGPIPTLTLKSPKGETFYGKRISTVSGYLDVEDEIALYADAHCYVQPSRGEGFGLMPLQAIAQGCPTILTGAHGHESFSHLGLPVSSKAMKADYFIFGDAGDWWEPSLDEICDLMRDVYDNYDKHVQYARESSQIALRDFTWRKCAERMVEAIGPERLGPYTGSGEWITTDAKKYKVETNRDYYCEIAGAQLQFYKGKTYYQTADIKRILFEAGVLSVECVQEDDAGLTDVQVSKLEKYVAQHENCPHCHQKLNSEPV